MKSVIVMFLVVWAVVYSACLNAQESIISSQPGFEIAEPGQDIEADLKDPQRINNNWDGSSSTDWFVAQNWSQNHVPISSEFVLIPSSLTNYPIVTGAGVCWMITVQAGASLSIGWGCSLTLGSGYNNYGLLAMYATNLSAGLYVGDDLKFQSGSSLSMNTGTSAPVISVQGDLEFYAGSNVDDLDGTFRFCDTGNSFIRSYAPAIIGNLVSDKDLTYYSAFSDVSSAELTIRNLDVYPESKHLGSYSGTVNVVGRIQVSAGGQLQCSAGTVVMLGSGNQTINLNDAGNYLHDFTINKSVANTVTLSSYLDLNGTMTIQSGTLVAGARTIYLGGHWWNNATLDNFNEGTGTVVIDGASDFQHLGNETFNNLVLNKIGYGMVFQAGANVTCNSFDYVSGDIHVQGGTFTALDLADPGIYGQIYVDGGTINYHQDTAQRIDLRGDISMTTGTFNVYGGSTNCWFSNVDTASLTMSEISGWLPPVLDIHDVGITIPSTPGFNDNLTGGTIRTAGGIHVQRSDFNPGGGIIELYGAGGSFSLVAGASFASLLINTSGFMNALSDLDINGNLTIQSGILNSNSHSIYLGGHWLNNIGPGGFIEGTGTVILDSSWDFQYLTTENFNNLVLNKSWGAMAIQDGPNVTCNSFDQYSGAIHMDGGTFTALDLARPGIRGTFYISTGTINFHQDTAQDIDWVSNVNVSMTGGTFNIYGGSRTCYISYHGLNTLVMSGDAVLDFKDMGILISSDSAFNDNITGGTIRTTGSFSTRRTDFNPTGGVIELYGDGDVYLGLGWDLGSNLYNLVINKSEPASVVVNGTLDINGNLNILSGYLNASNDSISLAGNWHNGMSPDHFTEGTGTVILDGSSNFQVISTENFNNLVLNQTSYGMVIEPGVTVTCNSFQVLSGYIHINGGTFNVLDLVDYGIFGTIWVNSGTVNYYQDAAQRIDLYGNLTMTGGTFNVYGGSSHSWFSMAIEAAVSLTMSGDAVLDFKDVGIYIPVSYYLFNYSLSGGTIRTAGDVYIYRSNFNPGGGTFEMYGSGITYIDMESGANFYNLVINSQGQVNAMRDLDINGNFTIQYGSFNASTYTISLAGDWINNAGPDHFIEGTGTVFLDGSTSYQNMSSENFNNLVLNKLGYGMAIQGGDVNVTCNSFDHISGEIHVNYATFTVLDLADSGIFGQIYTTNGTINYHQDAAQRIDLRGNLTMSGGTFNVYGGSADSWFSYVDVASLTMSGDAVLDFKDVGIHIPSEYAFNDNISGGTIRTTGNMGSYSVVFNPTAGTIELYGGTDRGVMTIPGSSIHNLKINQSGGFTSTGSLYVTGNLVFQSGYFNVLGILEVGGNMYLEGGTVFEASDCIIDCYGDIENHGYMSLVTTSSDTSLTLRMSNNKHITVYDGATLSVCPWDINATITCMDYGHYGLNIESGGHLNAVYTTFELMDQHGVNIKNGAWVDYLDGTFSSNVVGGTLLTINNNQNLFISAFFDGSASYNVTKTSNQGSVTLFGNGGNLFGPTYEQDPYNRIFWGGIPPVSDLNITNIPVSNQILLDWSYPVEADLYNIYRSTTPEGTFTHIGSTTATQWSQTITESHYFYKVTAVIGSEDPFTFVQGGTFNNDTSNVTLSSFVISKREVTQSEYVTVMGTNPSYFSGVANGPVEMVSWFSAIEYCNRRSMQEGLSPCYSFSGSGTDPNLWPPEWNGSPESHIYISCDWEANGYRLPTEAEWQFAAMGGTQTHNYTYSGSNNIDEVAWYATNAGNTTHTVGAKVCNELGLFDMSGNVFEWCWDIYGGYPTDDQTDPHGPASGSYRVTRGGCWWTDAGLCTVSNRSGTNATNIGNNLGFRVVRRF
jgi:formylglycine-generating enzyme required for sulfatase activity